MARLINGKKQRGSSKRNDALVVGPETSSPYRKGNKMKYPVAVVEKYGKAKKVEGNWYTNVSPQWGFDSKYVWVDKDIQQQVDLGTNEKEQKNIKRYKNL